MPTNYYQNYLHGVRNGVRRRACTHCDRTNITTHISNITGERLCRPCRGRQNAVSRTDETNRQLRELVDGFRHMDNHIHSEWTFNGTSSSVSSSSTKRKKKLNIKQKIQERCEMLYT